jgi:hypothetical protein
VLPLVLFVSLVVMRDTTAPVVDGARVVEVPVMVVMVMPGRGVLENLVCQDVQLSRLQIFLSTKVGEVMLGLA